LNPKFDQFTNSQLKQGKSSTISKSYRH